MKTTLVILSLCTLVAINALGQGMTKWKITDISKDKSETADGRIFIEMRVKSESKGDKYNGGTIDVAFEITDSTGQKYYYVSKADAPSPTTRVYPLDITNISKPVITGYAIELYLQNISTPSDTKYNGCKSRAELDARNLNSQKKQIGK